MNLSDATDFVWTHHADGVLAAAGVALAAPWLGIQLGARRSSALGLAVPKLASCGVALAYFFASTPAAGAELVEPDQMTRILFASIVAGLGMTIAAFTRRGQMQVGSIALPLFLLAIAARDLLFLESAFGDLGAAIEGPGRLLLIDPDDRSLAVATGLLGLAILATLWRPVSDAAFDPTDLRTRGGRPALRDLLLYLFVAAFVGVVTPLVGDDLVLGLLVLPPIILRPFAWSAASFPWLATSGSVTGVGLGFVVAVERDWPVGVSILVALPVTCLAVGLLASPLRVRQLLIARSTSARAGHR
ncbi:MAG: metal ABC transporter permease [Planctomycetota bacterium]